MNWYIGQDIVAINNHKHFKYGDEFKIKGLKSPFCKCGYIQIDIGMTDSSYDGVQCSKCKVETEFNGTLWFSEKNFAPLDPIKEAISELMEQTQVTPAPIPHAVEI